MHSPLPSESVSLLTPAYARASQKLDPESIQVYKWILKNWKITGEVGADRIHIVMARTHCFDDAVKAFIVKNPHARIINLGCGFCTRYFRLDNKYLTWLDIDLTKVIQTRDKMFAKELALRENYFMAIEDIGEMEELPEADLIIAEGFLPYFAQEKVAQWMEKSKADWIFDVIWNWKQLNTSFKWQYIESEWNHTVLSEYILDDHGFGYKVLHTR